MYKVLKTMPGIQYSMNVNDYYYCSGGGKSLEMIKVVLAFQC